MSKSFWQDLGDAATDVGMLVLDSGPYLVAAASVIQRIRDAVLSPSTQKTPNTQSLPWKSCDETEPVHPGN